MGENQGTSTQAVLTSLSANAIIFSIFMGFFLVFRVRFKRIYAPKSSFDLVPEEKRPEPLPLDPISWVFILFTRPHAFIIQHCGIDGYLFLRFLIVMGLTFAVGILTWVVLLPINAVQGRGNSGLDRFSISNVIDSHRYYAHAFISWVFYGGVLFMIYRELYLFVSLRAAFLTSPLYATKLPSRTVLFQSVPDAWLDEKQFFKLFNGVKRIHVTRNIRALVGKVKKRNDVAMRLEVATTNLLKAAMKAKMKADKKNHKEKKHTQAFLEVDDEKKDVLEAHQGFSLEKSEIFNWVPTEKRPRQRECGMFSAKVDTIETCKKELKTLDGDITRLQKKYRKFNPKNSIFVEFDDQYSAEIAHQTLLNHSPFTMAPAHIGLEPADIDWMNMRLFWWEKIVRKIIAFAAIFALVIFWAVPVAFVGVISNINYLTQKVPWLDFVNRCPNWLVGFITGLLPTALLFFLMALLPMFIRAMAQVAGCTSHQETEMYTHNAYFVFLFVNAFLVTAVASSASATVQQIIDNPTSVLSVLADNLPRSSNFFMSYLLLQGFSVAGGSLLQIVGLFLYYIFGSIFDKTLRRKWIRFSTLDSVQWGTTFPKFANLACVTMAFAIIAPLILLFAVAAMALSYLAFAHNLMYVLVEAPNSRGAHYPRALFQIFAGIYVGQISLLGMFIFGRGLGPIVLQAIGLIFTVFCHYQMHIAFDRLIQSVPLDCMKALDGVSTTDSFCCHSDYLSKVLSSRNKHNSRHFFKMEKEQQKTVRKDLLRALQKDKELAVVPLLADRDFESTRFKNFLVRFLRPDVYMSFHYVKKLLPAIYNIKADQVDEETSYYEPASIAKMPLLWIPKDPFGWSQEEINKSRDVLPMLDANSGFNKKGHIEFLGRPP